MLLDFSLWQAYKAAMDSITKEGPAKAISLEKMAQGGDISIITLVNTLITEAQALRASDIHIDPTQAGLVIRLRIDGMLQDKFHFEKAMLQRLNVSPEDFTGAFQQLPTQTRYLFTHAYQSHLFNEVIAERVRRGLLYAVEGDVLENDVPTAPLPGIKTTHATGLAGEIEADVLAREKVTPSLFGKATMTELASWGARKPMLLRVHDFRVQEIAADELYEGKTKATLTFWLEKGAYATTALRELLKNEEFPATTPVSSDQDV